MNKVQEESWIGVILMPVCVLVCGALAIGLAFFEALPLPLLLIQFAVFLAFSGYVWLIPSFSKRIFRKKGTVSFDERDRLIVSRAALAAYIVLWLYFVIVCVSAWWIVGPRGSISVNVLPFTLVGGSALFVFVHYLAILIQYGWPRKGEAS
ncbi:hypothetical protein ACFL6U_11755 [Planctomycetota bacterium]